MEIMKTKLKTNSMRLVSLNSCVEMESLFSAHKADISMIYASLKAYANTAFKIETWTKVVDSPKNSDIINYHSVVRSVRAVMRRVFFPFFQRNKCIFHRIVCCCVDFELALELVLGKSSYRTNNLFEQKRFECKGKSKHAAAQRMNWLENHRIDSFVFCQFERRFLRIEKNRIFNP